MRNPAYHFSVVLTAPCVATHFATCLDRTRYALQKLYMYVCARCFACHRCLTPALPTGLGGSLTVHDLNGSHGFEFINFKRFLRTRWCDGKASHGCTRACVAAPLHGAGGSSSGGSSSSSGSSDRVVVTSTNNGGVGTSDGRSGATTAAAPREEDATVDASLFEYFVLIPDTVRGPFLPNYVRHDAWPDLLTSQLSATVKLVGPSINCHGCDREARRCRTALHSEGHLMATDRVGLRLLTDFWRRPGHKGDAIGHNEMGSTRVLLNAGYNVASLQLYWRGHDFRDSASTSRKCAVLRAHAPVDKGGLVSCAGCYWNSTDLSPLEVLFVHRSISYDKIRRKEQGATPDYTAMQDELARLGGGVGAAGDEAAAAWPARPWVWRGREVRPNGGRGPWQTCKAACPAVA